MEETGIGRGAADACVGVYSYAMLVRPQNRWKFELADVRSCGIEASRVTTTEFTHTTILFHLQIGHFARELRGIRVISQRNAWTGMLLMHFTANPLRDEARIQWKIHFHITSSPYTRTHTFALCRQSKFHEHWDGKMSKKRRILCPCCSIILISDAWSLAWCNFTIDHGNVLKKWRYAMVCRVLKKNGRRPTFLRITPLVRTLAPIWFPHWPAWMWTISLIL